MTPTGADWRRHALDLAAHLAESGVLDDPAWRAAFEQVPRHVFMPRLHRQQAGGQWHETTASSAGWLDAVYADEPLVTALAETPSGSRVVVSSSTKPGLMARMLAALDAHDGLRVLEIGTGTGYNAGLLAHRLGGRNVYSLDIDAGLVADARRRLADLGLTPTLTAADGAHGLPRHAPYDRIIATCSVPAVPPAWTRQVREGGLVLVDLKYGSHAGNLVLLRRSGHVLEGRFLPRWAGFMPMRHDGSAHATGQGTASVRLDDGEQSSTTLDPNPWTAPVPWLLASGALPRHLRFGYRGRAANGPEWAVLTADEGSWCAVRMHPDEHGRRAVREHGPLRVWQQFERAHAEWDALGRPGWDRLGLTVAADGRHRVWLDAPDAAAAWDLTRP